VCLLTGDAGGFIAHLLTSARPAIFMTKHLCMSYFYSGTSIEGKEQAKNSAQHEHRVKLCGINPPELAIAKIRRSKFRIEVGHKSTGTRAPEEMLTNSLHRKRAFCGQRGSHVRRHGVETAAYTPG
jgi:hypothetical protein